MFPEPNILGNNFYDIFKVVPNQQRKSEWKKLKKSNTCKIRDKRKIKMDLPNNIGLENESPEVSLPGNASQFAVFATLRLAILERWMRQACEIYASSSACSPQLAPPQLSDDETEDISAEKTKESIQKIPKIVGVGLRSVFELIRESRSAHPALCTKALLALLDVLQGQQPEGLKNESIQVIEPLFELLLDLAMHPLPESETSNGGSQLTAVACACLLSLVTVRGDTGKLLKAVSALLMCPKPIASQKIILPNVLLELDRSVYSVLLGKLVCPDWLTHGVPKSSCVSTFTVKVGDTATSQLSVYSSASDGQFLYLHSTQGLFKIGSGYGGTIKGHVYACKEKFHNNEKSWLGYISNVLYFRGENSLMEWEVIDRNTLSAVQVVSVSSSYSPCDITSGVMFTDCNQFAVISAAKDDGFVVRYMNPTSPSTLCTDLPLKLARKTVEVFGSAVFDEEMNIHALHTGFDDEIASVISGKEFSLARTTSGKVLYSGKGSVLGIKQSWPRTGRWAELIIPKASKILQIAIGHEGSHAVLVAEDGSAYFTGTARRGEDGDQNKVRRQVKTVKPKKMAKVDGHFIVNAACNNGTTALVTREGELYMFGKDTSSCDSVTGLATELKDTQVTQIALGKAHAVALTSKGHIYTFGINNKGQCGREFTPLVKDSAPLVVAMETAIEEDAEDGDDSGQDAMCEPGSHRWKHDLCMVCTICRECTGYSISCLSSMRPDRNPGQECGCGEGDSGCEECGCCRICARESVDNSELAILGPSGAGDVAGMMRLDLIFGGRHGSRLQDHLQRRLDERKQRQRGRIGIVRYAANTRARLNQRPGSTQPSITSKHVSAKAQVSSSSNNLIVEDGLGGGAGSDIEKDATRVTSLPPARVILPSTSPVIQVACGLHHTVVLTQDGEVFTFGSNSYGQLGIGDVLVRGGPVGVKLPTPAVHVAAGSNHTVVVSAKGELYSFGSHQKNQLGRGAPSKENSRNHWYSMPGLVPQTGPRHGRRATWVGASADQTYVRIDESLINSISLKHSALVANKNCIMLLPTQCSQSKQFKCLVISKRDGNCIWFSGDNQVDFSRSIVCLDPLYNVLWSYQLNGNSSQISCYNVIASDVPVRSDQSDKSPSLLDCELTLPCIPGTSVSSAQVALHLLASLDTLTGSQHLQYSNLLSEDKPQPVSKHYPREDYCYVNRFEGHGGGWGYSGHSTEAIRFMVDSDILLGGFGLFGGRGEYTGKIKLFDIGMEGGDQEGDGELLAETEEIAYECGPRQKFPIFFEESVPLQANRWYVAWARVSGPSSDCGSGGQAIVSADDQVVFYFKTSKKSNNGTDVNAGQIPQLLYHLVTPESQAPSRHIDSTKEVYILSREFSRAASKECFESLLSLLEWSWASYKTSLVDAVQHSSGSVNHVLATLELKYLVYICCACLRLLRTYTTEIYPNQVSQKKRVLESVLLAESVGDVRALLRQILTDNLPSNYTGCKLSKTHGASSIYIKLTKEILDECHETFVACYHVFYPTVYLKWTSLCDLLLSTEKISVTKYDRLLSAVFAALCNPTVRLRSTFPIFSTVLETNELSLKRQLSPADNSGLPMMPCLDTHHYPILVEQMSYRSQLEGVRAQNTWTFKDVLDKLLDIIYIPVMQALSMEKVTYSKQLAHYCCQLIARIVAELTAQTTGVDEDVDGASGRVLYTTPSRFSRTNPTRTWNTGNGSPDAICFSVDRVGVVIAGVGVYGGAGNYDYELEILDNQSNVGQETQRWNSLQMTRGTFGPDDCNSDDISDIKFDYPIFIKENVKYAIRLRNHGGRTSNGDGGLSSVRGPDNTLFSFSTCSLSFNGTTQTRGQIPYILYYSDPTEQECAGGSKSLLEAQARKITLNIASAVVSRTVELFTLARQKEDFQTLSGVDLVTTLLPLMLAHIGPLASSEPRCGAQVLNLIQDLLPHVCALNLMAGSARLISGVDDVATDATTTSHHYAWVESEHPYKPATVSNYRVLFPENVQWMCLEFDSRSGTSQIEDSLQLFIPASAACMQQAAETEGEDVLPYWPVLHRLSAQPAHWPQSAVVLPGNEVIFSLETASDYIKDDKACTFGFRCLVIGYEWRSDPFDGLKQLETELSFLGGMCAASLMKKDLSLPFTINSEDIDTTDEETEAVCNQHMSLLGKGLALANPPTVSQALDGILPFSCPSNERLFLRDFVKAAAGTSGGRLAHWLQPDPYVDPDRCELVHPRSSLRCDCPATFTLHVRDQYGNAVQVPNLKVEIKAIPIEKKASDQRKSQRLSQCDQMTFGGHPQPSLDIPYQVTIKDRMNFYSISMMKAYENYSFEELRFMAPPLQRTCENMMVRAHPDGSLSATWTPASIGWYSIQVTIDDCPFPETTKVEVKEPPQGINPPHQSAARKASHQPSKIRKFAGKNSAGLRIRAHPSLQSDQIGIVPVGGTIAFLDETRNSDGVWVRLSQDTIRQYCQAIHDEAWCLQQNQHLGRTLLVPLTANPPTPKKPPPVEPSSIDTPTVYKVVMSGASGHNVRDAPSLKGTPVGMLVLGDTVTVIDHVVNNEGKWVRLSEETIMKKCLNQTAEAWSLALDKTQVAYLRPGNYESPQRKTSSRTFLSAEKEFSESPKKSLFDFGSGGSTCADLPQLNQNSPKLSPVHHNLFIFGTSGSVQTEVPRKSSSKTVAEKECSSPPKNSDLSTLSRLSSQASELASLSRILQKNSSIDSSTSSDDINPTKGIELSSNFWSNGQTVKVEDFKIQTDKTYPISRDFGEELQNVSVKELVSRANGNRITSSTTPRKISQNSNSIHSLTSASIPATQGRTRSQGTRESVDSCSSSPQHSSGISPLVSSSMIESGGGLSNTSAMVSSITPDPSSSEAASEKFPDDITKFELMEFNSNNYSKSLMQTGTQTSPDKGFQSCFNFGQLDQKVEQPRRLRKERIRSHKRSTSPPQIMAPQITTPSIIPKSKELSVSVKEAMSPSVAESLRAVFAALLWHEGIVHDAMACASFLKFYPTLPKQGVPVVQRHVNREKYASHRHSVEVSMADSYLHIKPSTLETLTRQAATANANRRSSKHKQQQSVIKEEGGTEKKPKEEKARKEKQEEEKVPTVSILPPALKCLVILWEELTSNCLQIFGSSAVSSQTNSSLNKFQNDETEVRRTLRKKKELKANTENSKHLGSKSNDKEAACELCGNFYPHPVTYHMRQAHPGCGGHAGGNGYNSGGNYCVGWAGNCGDGGLGGSSWYIICNTCREKYIEIMKRTSMKKSCRKKSSSHGVSNKAMSPTGTASVTSLLSGNETHLIMRDNAMFLLDLCGGSPRSMNLNQSPPDFINSEFPPAGLFQCLQSLGANPEILRDDSPPLELIPRRRDSDYFPSSRPLSVCESEYKGLFHRSISMGTNGLPWPDMKMFHSKKSSASICDPSTDSGSSLLGHPSTALQKLVPRVNEPSSLEVKGATQDSRLSLDIMTHPVLSFICQKHNLISLRSVMKQSLRKATCRVYAMQAFNWLLRSVTQATCLHDLLWWFVAALTPMQPALLTTSAVNKEEGSDVSKVDRKDLEEMGWVCEHPLSDMGLVGEAVYHLPSTFHILLQTIADLMLLLPMGSALQQMAVRCWGLRFTQTDHMFLHRSKVFSNISKILARSEEIEDPSHSLQESHISTFSQMGTYVEILTDLTTYVDIKASSRQAMIGSLTDNSTETFWESGDEDRSKTKSLTFVAPSNSSLRMVYAHIDNCRDIANKVSSIVFLAGPNGDELFKLRSVDVEVRASGWISCAVLNNNHNVVKLELKGPDSSLRVRQVRLLGEIEGESLRIAQQHSTSAIQQRNTEAETLRVFRLITAQVFGKLLEGRKETNNCEEGNEETNDLKEHMVGILFSRSKLTHLQKQVCMHIVQAIRRESAGMREDWEQRLCSSSRTSTSELSDSYCFEMLSMVLALSGSSVGRSYLAHQHGFLVDLSGLLHTGSARIQRQVILLLRRMLPEVSPSTLAHILHVDSLPPPDISVALATYRSQDVEFDCHRAGLLDVLLSCIAKALTVQIKVKGNKDSKGISSVSLATSIHPRDELGSRWWLRGSILRKLAEDIINLIKDMSSGKLSEGWAKITKAAIAECILNLTRQPESERESVNCLRSPTLWLALAALCVLHPDHVDSLSSAQWDTTADGKPPPPRPTCTNHDDGETSAIIQCNACGNLCADCDRFLHLHRRTRMHQRQVCKEEEEAIKVDLHEGCGRIKLFWILALADSCTLKAMVEFRERTRLQSKVPGLMLGVCRFCGTTGNSGLLAIGNICADQDCQEHAVNACVKIHPCGHMCAGVVGEIDCLPCLHGCGQDSMLKQDADDMCMICFTEALSCAPSIQLRCGHIFHLHCCKNQLMKKWAGPRITFSFQQCPICKAPIEHPSLNELLIPIRNLLEDVRRKALMRLEYEGLDRGRPDPASYAVERYAYYVCFKCNKAYYGGEARCDAELGRGDFDPSELVCGGCSDVSRAQMCPKHGTDFLEYKCRYCCSVAVFFCFGTTHFCNACHDDFQRVTNIPPAELPACPAGPKARQLEGDDCPLHIKHPPTGVEFALGCGVCRNAHTF